MSSGHRTALIPDPDAKGVEVLNAAPGSDTGQRSLAVRVISSLSGGGAGGPATIADGADIAEGATTDLASANTVVGLLKAVKAAVQGTLTTARTWTLSNLTDSVNVGNFPATQPVSGTFFQATQPVSLATNTPDVIDRVARLLGHVTVDNASVPVTGAFFQATQPVSLATNTPDVIDRAARLLGVVSNKDSTSANLAVTGTAAVGVALTITLPLVASQFHYITNIEIVNFTTALKTAAAAPVLVTTTNLPGNPIYSFAAPASAAGSTDTHTFAPTTPFKSSVAGTATTIVCPATALTIWRVNVTYFAAA